MTDGSRTRQPSSCDFSLLEQMSCLLLLSLLYFYYYYFTFFCSKCKEPLFLLCPQVTCSLPGTRVRGRRRCLSGVHLQPECVRMFLRHSFQVSRLLPLGFTVSAPSQDLVNLFTFVGATLTLASYHFAPQGGAWIHSSPQQRLWSFKESCEDRERKRKHF